MSASDPKVEELQRRVAELEAQLTEEKSERIRVEQFWKALLENNPDFVIFADLDRRIRYINRMYPTLRLEDVIGTSLSQWLPPESQALSEERISHVITTREPVVFEIKAIDHEGRPLWSHNRLGPVVVGGQLIGITYISTDVTPLKRAQEDLLGKAAELERSNDELNQFAYVASHDMHEPLRMVTAYLDLLRRRYGGSLPAEAQEFIDFAVGGARRMRALIDGLLEYARIGKNPVTRARVELPELVRAARDDLRIAIEQAGIQVVEAPLPPVMGDHTLLLRLFENLLSNAIKFRAAQGARVELSAAREDQRWRITVRDNGIGVEPSQLPKLFHLFQRLNAPGEYEGTGLGLSIAKKIVEQHGGRIWAESAGSGQGLAIHFTLPAA